MSEKYIDLTDRIEEGAEYSNTTSFCLGIECALRWLDEHPDQVPGRTITHSRVGKAMSGRSGDYKAGVLAGLALADAEQVPDSEPTNADELADYVRQIWRTAMSADECGRWLDMQGVKAPGGGDD